MCRGVVRRGDRVFIDSTLGQGPQWAAQCSRWSLEAQSVQNTGTNNSVWGAHLKNCLVLHTAFYEGKLKSEACPKEDKQVGTGSHGNNWWNGSV